MNFPDLIFFYNTTERRLLRLLLAIIALNKISLATLINGEAETLRVIRISPLNRCMPSNTTDDYNISITRMMAASERQEQLLLANIRIILKELRSNNKPNELASHVATIADTSNLAIIAPTKPIEDTLEHISEKLNKPVIRSDSIDNTSNKATSDNSAIDLSNVSNGYIGPAFNCRCTRMTYPQYYYSRKQDRRN